MAATVAIFDYGAGNIFSLKNSLEREGAAAVHVISDFEPDSSYDGLLLPGVGNFDPAMRALTRDSRDGFARYVKDGMPVLGICLGMEMFFAKSQEGSEPGLGVMQGDVISLPDTIKVPHMGWNNLQICSTGSRLLDGVKDGSWVYFVHSYVASIPAANNGLPADASMELGTTTHDSINKAGVITAQCDYNNIIIPAAVEYKNYFGTQFHPEKSGTVGRKMIQNFLEVCSR